MQKSDTPVALFTEALRNENNGHFEAAVLSYESALKQVKNVRYNTSFRNKIVEKIKILHTIIERKNNLRFLW